MNIKNSAVQLHIYVQYLEHCFSILWHKTIFTKMKRIPISDYNHALKFSNSVHIIKNKCIVQFVQRDKKLKSVQGSLKASFKFFCVQYTLQREVLKSYKIILVIIFVKINHISAMQEVVCFKRWTILLKENTIWLYPVHTFRGGIKVYKIMFRGADQARERGHGRGFRLYIILNVIPSSSPLFIWFRFMHVPVCLWKLHSFHYKI